MAFEVAGVLKQPLDVFLVGKLGVPGREELAMGAIASGGIRVIDRQVVDAIGLTDDEIGPVAARASQARSTRAGYSRRPRARQWSPKRMPSTDDGYATRMAGLVVIGYDGSEDAQGAIDVAGAALGAERAVVVNVWHGSLAAVEAMPPVGAPQPPPTPEQDAEFEQSAHRTAHEGAARARAAGFAAEAEIRRGGSAGEVAAALLEIANEQSADLVVVGRRGLSRIKTAVLGSVSDAIVRDGRRPVLVVPGRER